MICVISASSKLESINGSFPIQENKSLDIQGGLGWVAVSLLGLFVCLFDWFLSLAEWKFRRVLNFQGPPGPFVHNTWVAPGCVFKWFHQSQVYSLDIPKRRKGVKEGECTPRMTVGTTKHLNHVWVFTSEQSDDFC